MQKDYQTMLAITTLIACGVQSQSPSVSRCSALDQKICLIKGVATPCPFHSTIQACHTADDSNCTYCNDKTRTTEPLLPYAGNAHCFPLSKSCQVCGNLDPAIVSTLLASEYTIVMQPHCDVNIDYASGSTDAAVQITAPTVLSMKAIAIQTPPASRIQLQGACPIFIFDGVEEIELNDLSVECTSQTDPNTAAAFLVRNSPTAKIVATNVIVTGQAKSAITMLGGVFVNGVPVTTKTDMSGSAFDTIAIRSTLPGVLPAILSLAMFTSDTSIIVKNLDDHSRVVVQSGATQDGTEPNITLLGKQGSSLQSINLINVGQYLDDFGSDYEIQFYQQGAFSYTTSSASDLQVLVLQWQLAAFALLGVFLFALHTDLLYYWQHKSD